MQSFPSSAPAIGLIGPGNVGRALLGQLAQAASRHGGGGLRLHAIANSRRMRIAPQAFDDAEKTLEDGEALDLPHFAAHLHALHPAPTLIVDCSGSDAVAAHYADWLAAGIHVVTPNKQAG
ncbi:MAG: bifunctional aspartate kinase/homoserine dehydrogenase I, partial [Xanthomonadales bacterium]|nr:bifunctional aspartate kinase/homoserine dehydrogenase I [Xanthomonadales bacterium]